MTERTQRFWAFCANPDYYRIEDAVAEVEFDNWVTKGSDIRAGDRAVIWKAKGEHSDRSGIVALAEIVADPRPMRDLHPEYQPYPSLAPQEEPPEALVTLRYVPAPNLPLWLGGPSHDLLSSLSLVRAHGRRSVFRVEPEQWVALLQAAGGWRPPVVPPIGPIGFQRDAAMRIAVERRAMDVVMEYYQQAGWQVHDVSAQQSYDLLCTRSDAQELRVEVKGTTGDGSQVLLTTNEVLHARTHYPRVALCVVAHIRVSLTAAGTPEAGEGNLTVFDPWRVDDGRLAPVTYAYSLPPRTGR
jgi:predicted RNA-binding protein with PUA-like domain